MHFTRFSFRFRIITMYRLCSLTIILILDQTMYVHPKVELLSPVLMFMVSCMIQCDLCGHIKGATHSQSPRRHMLMHFQYCMPTLLVTYSMQVKGHSNIMGCGLFY